MRGRLRALVAAALSAALIGLGIAVVPIAAPSASAVTTALAVQQILADTNAIRAELGLQPLILNSGLTTVAQNWTSAQADAGDISHNPNLDDQIPAGYGWRGENVAAGYTYRTVVAGWKASNGHYLNMIKSDYTDIGIGYVERGGNTWFTQDFAEYSRPGPAAPVPSPTPLSAPIPKVSGNTIIDTRTNHAWVAHAVNFPSFEYACQQGWGYSQGGATDAAATAMASWGINAVRLPLNEQCWLGTDSNPHGGLTVSGYRAAIRSFVDILNAHGIVAILDLHWTAPPGQQADGQRAMTGSRSVLFWQSVAATYSKVPAVIFDAFNEPYSRGSFQLTWSCWKNGGCQAPIQNDVTATNGSTFTVVGMKTLVTTIRNAGAAQPIMLGGIDYSNDLRGWVANKPTDSQLIASWHNYPGQRCDYSACWEAEIAPVAAVVPIITGEFGWTDPEVDNMTPYMTWADAHGIGYAPWAWWVVDASESPSAALYALIQDSTTFAPKAPAGTAYFAHLQALPPTVRPPAAPPTRDGSGPTVTSPPGTAPVPRQPTTPGDHRPAVPGSPAHASAAPPTVTHAVAAPKVGLWRAPVLKLGLAVPGAPGSGGS